MPKRFPTCRGCWHVDNPPTSPTKDFFASPALSPSLARIFRDAESAAATPSTKVEERDEGSGGGGKRDDAVEISRENSVAMRSRSEDEFDPDVDQEDEDVGSHKNKKRKTYHRQTVEHIREMEAYLESPHPDEKQRQQLSKQLGLAPRQAKFWFQNSRTQLKVLSFDSHPRNMFPIERLQLAFD